VGAKVATPAVVTFRSPSSAVLCLEYRMGDNVYAVELCWDKEGRLVEGVDRRGRIPVFYSLQAHPTAAPEREPVPELKKIFARMGAGWLR
jgi:hypothetical protein